MLPEIYDIVVAVLLIPGRTADDLRTLDLSALLLEEVGGNLSCLIVPDV
jgi:hypothetical protein